MPIQYTKEQLWGIYEKLPQELKEAVFSDETATHISNACEEAQVPDNLIPRVAAQIGNVLMGIILPNQLEKVLETEIGLKKPAAQAVSQDINRFVFYPVKAELEALHTKVGEKEAPGTVTVPPPRHSDTREPMVAPPPQPQEEDGYIVREKPQTPPAPQETPQETIPQEEAPQEKIPDTYRETTE